MDLHCGKSLTSTDVHGSASTQDYSLLVSLGQGSLPACHLQCTQCRWESTPSRQTAACTCVPSNSDMQDVHTHSHGTTGVRGCDSKKCRGAPPAKLSMAASLATHHEQQHLRSCHPFSACQPWPLLLTMPAGQQLPAGTTTRQANSCQVDHAQVQPSQGGPAAPTSSSPPLQACPSTPSTPGPSQHPHLSSAVAPLSHTAAAHALWPPQPLEPPAPSPPALTRQQQASGSQGQASSGGGGAGGWLVRGGCRGAIHLMASAPAAPLRAFLKPQGGSSHMPSPVPSPPTNGNAPACWAATLSCPHPIDPPPTPLTPHHQKPDTQLLPDPVCDAAPPPAFSCIVRPAEELAQLTPSSPSSCTKMPLSHQPHRAGAAAMRKSHPLQSLRSLRQHMALRRHQLQAAGQSSGEAGGVIRPGGQQAPEADALATCRQAHPGGRAPEGCTCDQLQGCTCAQDSSCSGSDEACPSPVMDHWPPCRSPAQLLPLTGPSQAPPGPCSTLHQDHPQDLHQLPGTCPPQASPGQPQVHSFPKEGVDLSSQPETRTTAQLLVGMGPTGMTREAVLSADALRQQRQAVGPGGLSAAFNRLPAEGRTSRSSISSFSSTARSSGGKEEPDSSSQLQSHQLQQPLHQQQAPRPEQQQQPLPQLPPAAHLPLQLSSALANKQRVLTSADSHALQPAPPHSTFLSSPAANTCTSIPQGAVFSPEPLPHGQPLSKVAGCSNGSSCDPRQAWQPLQAAAALGPIAHAAGACTIAKPGMPCFGLPLQHCLGIGSGPVAQCPKTWLSVTPLKAQPSGLIAGRALPAALELHPDALRHLQPGVSIALMTAVSSPSQQDGQAHARPPSDPRTRWWRPSTPGSAGGGFCDTRHDAVIQRQTRLLQRQQRAEAALARPQPGLQRAVSCRAACEGPCNEFTRGAWQAGASLGAASCGSPKDPLPRPLHSGVPSNHTLSRAHASPQPGNDVHMMRPAAGSIEATGVQPIRPAAPTTLVTSGRWSAAAGPMPGVQRCNPHKMPPPHRQQASAARTRSKTVGPGQVEEEASGPWSWGWVWRLGAELVGLGPQAVWNGAGQEERERWSRVGLR
ncbi:hypothetical protein V8C86DRAFT_1092598 [Haematococcus lacustris]